MSKTKQTEAIKPEFSGALKRLGGFAVDFFLLYFLRGIFISLLSALYIAPKWNSVIQKFSIIFQKNISFGNMTKGEFLYLVKNGLVTDIFLIIFVIALVGLIYNVLLVLSSWKGTLGQKIFSLSLLEEDYSTPSISRISFRYILSLVPWFANWILIIVMAALYKAQGNPNIGMLMMLTFIFIITWYDLVLFTKKKQTLHDIAFRTIVVKEKNGNFIPKWKSENFKLFK